MNYLNSCYHVNQNIIQSAISQKKMHIQQKGEYSMQTISFQQDKNELFKHILNNLYLLFKYNKKCHKHVTNAPKGIGLA